MTTEEVKPRKIICCVPTCYGERFDLAHKFPSEPERYDKWLSALDVPELYTIPRIKMQKQFYVCSRHFRNEDYKNAQSRSLNQTAVPSLNIKNLDDIHLVTKRAFPRPPDLCSNGEMSKLTLVRKRTSRAALDGVTTLSTGYDHLGKNMRVEDSNLEAEGNQSEKIEVLVDATGPLSFTPEKLEDDCIETETSNEAEVLFEQLEDETPVTETEPIPEFLEVSHPNHSGVLKIANIWLRDQCRCEECYSTEGSQLKWALSDVDVQPAITEVTGTDSLYVLWSDGHESEYDFEFLYKSQVRSSPNNHRIPWSDDCNFSNVEFPQLVAKDEIVEKALRSILLHGVLLVRRVPLDEHMRELAIRRIFPTLMNMKSDQSERGELHTDKSFCCDVPGLKVLHCVDQRQVQGRVTLMDGLRSAEELRTLNRKAFQLLSEVAVPFQHQEHTYSAPIIRLHSFTEEIEQIRLSLSNRGVFNTISQEEMPKFYSAFREFVHITKSRPVSCDLNHDTLLIIDNWRVLSSLEEGVATTCYISRTEFLSKTRRLGLS